MFQHFFVRNHFPVHKKSHKHYLSNPPSIQMAEFHVEIALLSGRTAHVTASPENSTVRQVMLDAGKALRIAIGTLTRQETRFSGTGNKNPVEIGQEV